MTEKLKRSKIEKLKFRSSYASFGGQVVKGNFACKIRAGGTQRQRRGVICSPRAAPREICTPPEIER